MKICPDCRTPIYSLMFIGAINDGQNLLSIFLLLEERAAP